MSDDLELEFGDAPVEGAAPPAAPAKKVKPKGMPKTVRIMLEDNEVIPPTGLFIGHNGRTFLLRAGEEVEVPIEVVNILNDAVMSVAITDAEKNVIGYRDRMRYPYRLLRGA